jgi:hypothetical protein
MARNTGGKAIPMRPLKFPLSILFLSLLILASRAGEKSSAARGASLEFAFGKEPLVYSFHQNTESKMYISNPSASAAGAPYANGSGQTMTKSSADLRFKFRLTAVGPAKNGVIPVRYEPFDYEADLESTGSAGHFVTTVRGLDVKSTQNGILTVDTRKEIGFTQAKAIKIDAYPNLLSGTFDFGARGEIKSIHGDLPFVDTWGQQEKLQIGLFGFQLPDHAVTNGETWQIVVSTKSAGPVKFDGEPLNQTNFFTLVEESSTDDLPIATFKLSAPMLSHDISGYIEERGQSTHADMSEFELHGLGMIRFDKKRGVLVDENISRSATITMTMLVQGRAMSSHTENRVKTEINLLPSSTETTNGKNPAEKPAARKTL